MSASFGGDCSSKALLIASLTVGEYSLSGLLGISLLCLLLDRGQIVSCTLRYLYSRITVNINNNKIKTTKRLKLFPSEFVKVKRINRAMFHYQCTQMPDRWAGWVGVV